MFLLFQHASCFNAATPTVLVFLQPAGVWFGKFRMAVKTDQGFEADFRVLGSEFEEIYSWSL